MFSETTKLGGLKEKLTGGETSVLNVVEVFTYSISVLKD